MRYKIFGKTGLFVSEMCLGTMGYGANPGPYAAAGWLEEDETEPIFRRAIDAGVNLIDTANVYSGGRSEEIVGRMFKKIGVSRHDFILATKGEHAVGNKPNDAGASRYHLIREVKASLKRLGTDYIDLYQLHGWDPATPVEETVRALDDLVRQGHIRYLGVSNWAAWQITKALGISKSLNASPFQSLQAYYSLAARDIEREIVPMLKEENLGLMIWSPLSGGYLTGKYRTDKDNGRRKSVPFPPVNEKKGEFVLAAMDGIAAEHNVPLATIAIAWLLHQQVVTSVVLGAKGVDQLEDQLKAADIKLSQEELKTLDSPSALASEYPGWMFVQSEKERRELLTTGKLTDQH